MKHQNLFLLGIVGIFCAFAGIAQDFNQKINEQLLQEVESNSLTKSDLQWIITNQNSSRTSNTAHVYYRQSLNGYEIYGTESSLHLDAKGNLLTSNSSFLKNIASRSSVNTPSLSAIDAVNAAAQQLNYTVSEELSIIKEERGTDKKTLITTGGISKTPIPARLIYQRTEDDTVVLAWNLSIQEKAQQNWWSVRVNAITGEIINKNNWMVQCNLGHSHEHDSKEVLDYNKNLYDIPNYKETTAANGGCVECYEVFELPLESPLYGNRSIANTPADPVASPFGWHDTNGVAGAEFTVTRGNNVNAFEDGDNSGFQPDGGPNLDFTGYPFDQVWTNGNQYEEAAITSLFYWNNIVHDVVYQYGFDEQGGNFQENNYGNGGLGNDSVSGEGQKGQTCNAFFGTPDDGQSPTMLMYVCNDRDGDFDALVMIHEYGHGISNRLTGGPSNSGCLGNEEQMGEGWSDWYGAVMTATSNQNGAEARGVGTYLFGQGPGGTGIRPFPYSTDLNVNPHTYDDIKVESVPHGVGSVWAAMLWEMTWGLIDAHGFDADIYNFTGDINQDAGNVMALALVTEGMKLQPCSPGFVDGRDAILAADAAIYGGANECIIWDAFAKRGLGVSADQGSSNSRSDGTEAFDTPSGVAEFTAPEDVCASSGELTGLSGGTPSGGVYSGPGVSDDGNGATYSFDPIAAGVGVHTITYDVPAGVCSVASSASDDIEVISVPDGPTTEGVSDFCIGDEITVTATPVDPANVIRWFDAQTGGNFLFEGTSYTFTPTETTTVYAQENAPGPLSQLVISEFTLETPDRLEIQNVGEAFDYSGYSVAVSADPYPDVNAMNSVVQTLGFMDANSVVDYNDDGGAGYWGDNIWWDNEGTGWIIIIDDQGNVVDSVFWNFTAAQISGLNVTINGFVVTAADLDWTGPGAIITEECSGSFRRNGDTNTGADWPDVCATADYGVANSDINLGLEGCLALRTPTDVTAETEPPVLTCPDDDTVTINEGDLYEIPDVTGSIVATDNCTANPIITQDPVAGTEVGGGDTTMTITATDEAGNEATCTYTITVEVLLGFEDNELANAFVVYPNPTEGAITIENKSTTSIVAIAITDVNGRNIKTLDPSTFNSSIEFSLEELATGLYFVSIETERTTLVKRIIKK